MPYCPKIFNTIREFQPVSREMEKFSPCKLNLMLAITGVRPDGFHNLISLAAPTRFGDTLHAEILSADADSDILESDEPSVPCDASNLVIKAAQLFREASGCGKYFHFRLEKRVPAGAGLGGGSSNGVAALEAANELCGNPLPKCALADLAAKLGSDCPMFLEKSPIVMRGRGEKVFKLMDRAAKCLDGVKYLIFKPNFSINTGWAYSKMRENPQDYADPDMAEALLSEWLENPSISGIPLFNNMQIEAFKKYPALDVVLCDIRARFRVPAMMSGSGSACFAIVNNLDAKALDAMKSRIRELLGQGCFIADA